MPYAPSPTKAKTKIIFSEEKIVFFNKMNFVFLNAIKILSIMELREAKIMKKMKRNARRMFSWININLGEKVFTPIRKIDAIIIVEKITNVKLVLILLFLSFDFGRYLIKPIFNPNKLNPVIKPITEIIVVAKPMCSVE